MFWIKKIITTLLKLLNSFFYMEDKKKGKSDHDNHGHDHDNHGHNNDHCNEDKPKVHLALIFKDFAAWLKASCVGLNVAGYTTASVLKENGVNVSVFPVRHNVDVIKSIDDYKKEHGHDLTHVVISAPWLTVFDLKAILNRYPKIKFVILSHSNVGFLQADPWGVDLLRHYIELTKTYSNLEVGGNSFKFVAWLDIAYRYNSILLPNLYPLGDRPVLKHHHHHPVVKIGIFGAPRAEKNLMTAAAAAIVIQRELGVPVEVHLNTGGEAQKSRVVDAIEQMYKNLDGLTLIEHNWMYWNDFIKLIADMDIMLQPSYTESFNMVTADGISVGVPTVVSEAIYWAPNSWKAEVDDALDIARVGLKLLKDPTAAIDGFDALKQHDRNSLKYWMKFLDNK